MDGPGVEKGRLADPAGQVDATPVLTCRSTSPDGPAIRWTDAARRSPRERSRYQAWCNSVGPALNQPAAAAPHPPALTSVQTVAIISWNTHVGAGDLRRLVAFVTSGGASDGRRPDTVVLLLQEVLRRSPQLPPLSPLTPVPRPIAPRHPAGEVSGWARDLGLHLAYVPAMRNGRGPEDRGNAILATRPLTDVEAIELPFTRQRRVAVAASIELDGQGAGAQSLRLVSAHFDTGLALTRGGPAQLRLRAARVLVSALQGVTGPVIAGGDLNASWGDDEPAVRLLRQHLPDGSRGDRGNTWYGPAGSRGRLDYVFARTGGQPIAVTRLSDRFGSDHYPLLVWFDVSAGPD